jgi:hypothetical protein
MSSSPKPVLLMGQILNGIGLLPVAVDPTGAIETVSSGGGATTTDIQGFAGTAHGFRAFNVAFIFKTAFVTASGSTVVWTPTTSTQFVLMGYTISIAGTLAATGPLRIQLIDGPTNSKTIANHMAAVSNPIAGDTQIGSDWGNGYIGQVGNNTLSINLSAAMTTGGVGIDVWGVEF